MGYTVYMHIFPNGKKYIGITSQEDVEKRWQNGFGYKSQFVFLAIVKFGWDNVEHQILFTGLSKDEAEEKERKLIELYETNDYLNGYNIANGGSSDGMHSETTKRKISESKTGRIVSEETREKFRLAMTPEKQRKMILASVKKCSKPVRCIESGKEYMSASEASRETGADVTAIVRCCKKLKRYKTAGGYHWEYVN